MHRDLKPANLLLSKDSHTIKFADWGITYTSRGSGIVDIKLTDTQTNNFIVGTLK